MPQSQSTEHTEGSIVASYAALDVAEALRKIDSRPTGLTSMEVKDRLASFGYNRIGGKDREHWVVKLASYFKDPLILLLVCIGVIAYATGDPRTSVIIAVMAALSISLRFVQEMRADAAEQKIQSIVRKMATVQRNGSMIDVSLEEVVPGDIIQLNAGDIIPADLRMLSSKNLYVNESTLTGESMPAEKNSKSAVISRALEAQNLCFMGTYVESGTGTAVALVTGQHTYFGSLAHTIVSASEETAFDRGAKKFTILMLWFMAIMVPLVFLIIGAGKHDWYEAFFFSLAIAVGLAPEMLPMIVTVNLSKGAIDMSRKKVIVKRLNAIQNFGAMDVLATDKTGTLTTGSVVLIQHVDVNGHENESIIKYAFINSVFQTGLKNLLDEAVLHHHAKHEPAIRKAYTKIDELPFDFDRRRMSVIVEGRADQERMIVCKGAVDEMLSVCTSVQNGSKIDHFNQTHVHQAHALVEKLGAEGFRLLALGYRTIPHKESYEIADEAKLTLLGFLAFLDPPKASAARAIRELRHDGVTVKILTGDVSIVAKAICSQVGLQVDEIMDGATVDALDDAALGERVEKVSVFAKLEPKHKVRIIQALQRLGHTVGFMGDGINDAPALKSADIGISVDTAVDVAREASDIILLEKSLRVLNDGVLEGRKVFGNIMKYMKMAASSAFGNMLSVLGASIFLPFVPMLPLQIIINNLLYDFSQSTIPTDSVDPEYLRVPRTWNIAALRNYIIAIGPLSSIFDYVTYGIMIFVFNAWTNPTLFHTGWFVESLLSQTLIIHILRTGKIPFVQSRASLALIVSTTCVAAIGIWLPFSQFASTLGFVALPALYWPLLIAMLMLYGIVVTFVTRALGKRFPL